jgi:hypothetical protein
MIELPDIRTISLLRGAHRDRVNFGDERLPPRFWDKVQPCPMSGCWIWTGATTSHGYGNASTGAKRGLRMVPAHRLSFETLVAPVGVLVLDHLCAVKSCVNPLHLDPVTSAENTRRAASKITHCPKGHEYAGRNLIARKGGRRGCRACTYARAEAYRQRCVASFEEAIAMTEAANG